MGTLFPSNAILPLPLVYFHQLSSLAIPSPMFFMLLLAASFETAQQEERLGREQRRKADDAVREAKALSEELDRLKKDRTVGFGCRR